MKAFRVAIVMKSIFFSYVGPLIRLGRQRPLTADDAPPLPPPLQPRTVSEDFERLPTTSFQRFIFGAYFATGAPARRIVIVTILRVTIAVSTPLLLRSLLTSIPELTSLSTGAFLTAVALGLTGMVGAIFQQHFYFNALQMYATIVNGMNRRVMLQALRLRRSARARMQTGDLVNHLSSDSDAVAEAGFFIPEVFASLLQITAVLIILFVLLGWAALASAVTLSIMIPITILVAKRYRKLDHTIMALRDERVTLMSQILQGIRVVKYHAWEDSVRREVQDVRSKEITTRIRIVKTDGLSTVLFISTTTLVAFVGFSTHALLGGEITAPLVFACLALFAMLEEPFGMISHLLANIQHARVAVERLHGFFTAEVRDEDHRQLSEPHKAVGLSVEQLGLTYADAEFAAVNNVSMTIKAGSSVAIVGTVGSGKSTLLRMLAGVQVASRGTLEWSGITSHERARAAYVPQEAFILNASIFDNIAFGENVHEAELQDVIRDCALEKDMADLPSGVKTEIGERGVNLSGGQKQRLSLARAAAHSPGIVFLDDPLSAVDVATEDSLVERLLFGRWSGITRVMATHRLAHLRRFDTIVFLAQGHVQAIGSFDDVYTNSAAFRDYIAEEERGVEAARDISVNVEPSPTSTEHPAGHDIEVLLEEPTSRFTDDEDRETGAVRLDVYRAYARAMIGSATSAPLIAFALVLTAIGITVLPIVQTMWLGWWSDNGRTGFDSLTAIAIYGVIGVFVLLGWYTERLVWLYRAAAAGRSIHDAALRGVLFAPLRFFDRTPIGRILNRFARDQEGVDDHLSWNVEQSVKSLSQTIGHLAVILTTMPFMILVIVPVLAIYHRLQRDYRTAAREAKRLESIARSPRYAQFKETVTGLDVIHGFGREHVFLEAFYGILERYQRSYWCSILLNRWFSIRVPLVSGLVAMATSIGIVLLASHGLITQGMAGVVMTYAMMFWMSLNWTVRAFSEVESRMTAVERLRHYGSLEAEHLTTSTPVLSEDTAWPTEGELHIEHLGVRYADNLPMVLRDVNIHIPARSKVGIVGRTGSGKSTLFQTLFRFVEPTVGTITIDGVDITSVPLSRLRRAIAIIPQDPTLFIGTIRSNLDRFSECTDDEVWTALRRVRLDDVVRALPEGLDAEVVENGANFSQGQRQLLCMARAILTRARIIVLDEATASVDVETDAVIQQTVRDEFSDVTVLTIAHRLHTVADADVIIELDKGRQVTRR